MSPTDRPADAHAPHSKDFFLARQPILDRQQNLVAYELLCRNAASGPAAIADDLSATASVFAHVAELGLENVVGDVMGFVNIDAAVLLSEFIKFLPADKVVLEILETVEATPAVLERVATLKQAGYRFALDDVISNSADVRKLTPLVEIVKIDIMGMPHAQLCQLARSLRVPERKLLAEKVETRAEFDMCLALGFDYFQGYYFAKPLVMKGKKLAPSELAIVQLLQLIDSDADNSEIEARIKGDAMIAINILRLVNTPAAGSKTRIDSLGQALMVLGRRQLQRWLQVLLYARPDKGGGGSSLLSLAIYRAKLLELMTARLYPRQSAMADTAFSVGVMSLMETLFAIPLAELLSTMDVGDEVSTALLERGGQYGAMLAIVEDIEKGEHSSTLPLAALHQLGISAETLCELQLRAVEWTTIVARST